MNAGNIAEIKDSVHKINDEQSLPAVFVHKKISHVAARHPHAVAVSCGDETLSFHELESLSNSLAHYLVQKGVRPESRVGICMEPGLSLAVVILGILKSGGAYIHLSPSLPPNRIEAILNDADAALLITGPSVARHLPAIKKEVLTFDIDQWKSLPGEDHCPSVNLAPHHAAYILYTSGSTGKPKGVIIEHRQLSYYLNWTVGEFANAINVKIPLTSSMSFAAGVTQFYSALLKGYTLHILPPDIIRQPFELMKWYNSHPGFGLYCVPTLWNEILNWKELNNDNRLSGPACIILSGEAVSEKLVKRTYDLMPGIKAWNLYGPTESVANLSAGRLLPGQKISIGNPLPGTKLFIVKENGAEALPGESGELLAAGNGIARGYLNREELTAEKFITYHSQAFGNLRVYRTGDIVKLQEDGAIIYVGRNDQQVKIRGFRIELMEVELALKQLNSLKEAVVKSYEITPAEKILAAYVMPKTKGTLSVSDLRRELATILPDYMLPERWVFMDEFPTLANGKIDRGQLPLPGNPRPDLGYAAAIAATEAEQKMVKIFEKVLGFSGIGANDNFFDLGGTSLKINTIIYEVKQTFGVAATYRDVFTCPTPKSLLKSLDSALQADIRHPDIAAAIHESDTIPLTPNQAGLWFLQLLNKNSTAYNIPYTISINGPLDIPCLKQALQAVADRHIPLRSSVAVIKGIPVSRACKNFKIDWELADLSFMRREESLKKAQDAIELSATVPFDLLTAPLFRVRLYKLAKEEYLLGLVVHHIIFDGWSVNIFHRELLNNYSALLQGFAPQYPPLTASYSDFALEYEKYSAGNALKQARSFWKKQLGNTSNQFIFPYDFSPASDKSEQGGRIEYHLNARLKEQLKSLNKQYGVTPYITLMSAFMVLVHRYNNQPDMLIATAVANRHNPAFYPLIGYFTNTLLIRANLSPGMSFTDFLIHVKNACLEAFEYEQIPYSEQIRVLHEQGSAVSASGVGIMFAYHESFEEPVNNILQTRVAELFNRSAKFPLFLECQDEEEGIKVALTYDKHLYSEQSIVMLMSQYTALLNAITSDPARKTENYELTNDVEEYRQPEMQSGGKKKFSDTMLVHRLFEQAADKYSENIAVRYDDTGYTYRQIEEWSNLLAWQLTERGIAANEPVGIFMEHSAAMIAAILAVLKIGAHYVPLDPEYPAKRNIYVTEHSRLRVIIANSSLADKIPHKVSIVISADEFITGGDPQKIKRPDCPATTPDSLVYVMYTSGSTGNPKGVMVPHKGVSNYLLWMQDQFVIGPKDNILAKTSISFDVSVWELFLPLISGGRLILNDRHLMKAPEQLAKVIKAERVNIVQFVPSGLKAYADAGVLRECITLEKIFCGGEKMPVQLQEEVFRQFDGELHNLYGPTEASIFVCHYQCSRADRYRSVPIGKPIPNSGIVILDEHLNTMPGGCVGDIYIYGDILAKGYLYDEKQTNAVFINSPHENTPAVIYKTGDRGRFLFNGNIEYHGRTDHQVKVRGYRIELGEIEQALMRYPGVSGAVVTRKELSEADVRLNAYIVSANAVSEQDLRQFMRQNLPDYMLPSGYYFVEQIPVLPNGKTNFHALEASATLNRQEHSTSSEHFRDDVEKVLAGIWVEVLGRNDFKPTDNFMDAGGHSILLAKVCTLINDRLKQNYSILDLFQYPSIDAFAKHYREKYLKSSSASIGTVQDRIAKRKNKLNELRKRNN